MANRNGVKGSKQHNQYLVTRKVDIRKSHPSLYITIMIIAFICIGEGVNFLYSTPTFKPYGISGDLIGSIFLAIGLSKIVFLNLYRNLLLVRLTASLSSGFLLFWGITNTQQSFLGKASFQLPIFIIGLALVQLRLVLEPSVNPITMKKDFE